MKGAKKSWGVVAGAAAVLVFGVAAAQEPEAAPTAPPVAPELQAQRDVQLSPAQMLQQAETFLPDMERGQRTVRQQLSKAREARDVVKVLCLNDKLTQINVAIRSATDRVTNLRAANTRSDADGARHEFTVLQVLRDRVRTLVTEANQCIGEETGFVGDSRLTVDIDPEIPDDPSDFPDDPFVSTPPTLSSPIQ